MFEIAAQCCDASYYLELAQACAQQGQCYNDLRPMGMQLWLALPLWLGLPQNTVIVGHWLLLLVSVLLATMALQPHITSTKSAPNLSRGLIFCALLAIHVYIFWPVMSVTLADAPAGLIALIGLWLLLLAEREAAKRRAVLLAIAGLSLGLAVFFRAFYLYPVLLLLLTYLLLDWRRKSLQQAAFALLIALLPIAVQYSATWSNTGKVGFIDPAMSEKFSGLHFRHNGIGYDTSLAEKAVIHYSACQTRRGGLIEIALTLDVQELLCFFGSRIGFYAASDLRVTYIDDGGYPNLISYPENLELVGAWPRYNLKVIADDALAPSGFKHAERLQMIEDEPGVIAEFNTVVINQSDDDFSASIWLWAEQETPVTLRWFKFWGGDLIQSKEVLLSAEPQRFQLHSFLPAGVYYFGLLMPTLTQGESIIAWGAQVERAVSASSFSEVSSPVTARSWSLMRGLVNAVLLLLALSLLCHRQFRTVSWLAVYFFCGLLFAQSIIIVPEQRFAVVYHVLIWALGIFAPWLHLSLLRDAEPATK